MRKPYKTRLHPFYYCEYCSLTHDAKLDEMREHIQTIRGLKLHAYLLKQGKANVLKVLR